MPAAGSAQTFWSLTSVRSWQLSPKLVSHVASVVQMRGQFGATSQTLPAAPKSQQS
jgi:hypothetical protein